MYVAGKHPEKSSNKDPTCLSRMLVLIGCGWRISFR